MHFVGLQKKLARQSPSLSEVAAAELALVGTNGNPMSSLVNLIEMLVILTILHYKVCCILKVYCFKSKIMVT
jgi:hypothetical protein